MITVPTEHRELLAFARTMVEQCRVSAASRSAYYQGLNQIAETGRYDGQKALINKIDPHLSRIAAHLFSPVELKFSIDYDRMRPKQDLDRAKVAALQLTRQWDRASSDILFGRGVLESLKYGWCGTKQWAQSEGKPETVKQYKKLVMPWNFGVYNEVETDITLQPVLCETMALTLPEVWRRIWHLPNAKKLFERIRTHAAPGQVQNANQSFFHQVLSTNQLQTSNPNGFSGTLPGGMVNVSSGGSFQIMGPQVAAETITMHELWVQGADDYVTLQLIEPDILVSPPVVENKVLRHSNLLGLLGKQQPYRSIVINETSNWFWGKSEVACMAEPQQFFAGLCDDMRRLIGVQVEKILFFSGENKITDELYGQMRMAGYGSLDPNTKVEDMTPKFPGELLPVIKFVIEQMDINSGFPPIMQGQGEQGVRAGSHAGTLMKTGSPTLRDRALIAERACAVAADLTMEIKEAKDDSTYWTKADTIQDVRQTAFNLTDLPDDWRVTVDSHSSSPIFSDENAQLIMAAHSKGLVQSEYVINNLPFPNREDALAQNKQAAQEKQAMIKQLMAENPEAAEKVLAKTLGGGRR
jgi:hypothetical protein